MLNTARECRTAEGHRPTPLHNQLSDPNTCPVKYAKASSVTTRPIKTVAGIVDITTGTATDDTLFTQKPTEFYL